VSAALALIAVEGGHTDWVSDDAKREHDPPGTVHAPDESRCQPHSHSHDAVVLSASSAHRPLSPQDGSQPSTDCGAIKATTGFNADKVRIA
jgi:hypothetical protein